MANLGQPGSRSPPSCLMIIKASMALEYIQLEQLYMDSYFRYLFVTQLRNELGIG